jgi:hypothetical protein
MRASALEDSFVLYKTVNGVRSAFDIVGRKGGYGVSVSVPAETWHSLRIDFKANRFRAASGCRLISSLWGKSGAAFQLAQDESPLAGDSTSGAPGLSD